MKYYFGLSLMVYITKLSPIQLAIILYGLDPITQFH